jgi:hypothetical protein
MPELIIDQLGDKTLLQGKENIFLSEVTIFEVIGTRTKAAFVDTSMKCFDLVLKRAGHKVGN